MIDKQHISKKESEKIYDSLGRICQSKSFAKSTNNRALLEYLVQSTLEGKLPKEYTIANEVFGKAINDEINVRAYIHNLRRKLEAYYQNEGLDDEIEFRLPKGRYLIEFRVRKKDQSWLIGFKQHRIKIIYFLFGIIISAISFWILSPKLNDERNADNFIKDSTIWGGFDNGKETIITIGDHYFFSDSLSVDTTFYSHSVTINSEDDLRQFLLQHPEKVGNIKAKRVSFMDRQALYGMYHLMPVISSLKEKISISLLSELDWKSLPNKNIIFIGSYRSTQFLEVVLHQVGINYNLEKYSISYSSDKGLIKYPLKRKPTRVDYPSIVRFSSSSDCQFIGFFSKFDVGNTSISKYFGTKNTLVHFEDELSKRGMSDFKAIFKVSGSGAQEFNSELISLDSISNPQFIINTWP